MGRGDLARQGRQGAGRPLAEAGRLEGRRALRGRAVLRQRPRDQRTARRRRARSAGMSWGQYGNRVGVPRILGVLDKAQVPASFFVPAVSAPAPSRRAAAHRRRGPRDRPARLDPRGQHPGAAGEGARADVARRRHAGTDHGHPPGRHAHAVLGFSAATLGIERELGLLYDSSLMADDDPYEIVGDGEATGIVELPVEWIRDDAVYFNMNRFTAHPALHAAPGRARHLPPRVRPRLGRGRPVPSDHAPARHRLPLAHLHPGRADRAMRRRRAASGSPPMPTSHAM